MRRCVFTANSLPKRPTKSIQPTAWPGPSWLPAKVELHGSSTACLSILTAITLLNWLRTRLPLEAREHTSIALLRGPTALENQCLFLLYFAVKYVNYIAHDWMCHQFITVAKSKIIYNIEPTSSKNKIIKIITKKKTGTGTVYAR